MSKREDCKRSIVFFLAGLLILAVTLVFAYVWYDYYLDRLAWKPFWRRGNWVMIAVYAVIFTMVARLYGGLKVGYLKKIDEFYSLTLTVICANIAEYVQITLVNRYFLDPLPLVKMTGVQIVLVVLWIFISGHIYSRIYRARRLLVIHGDRDPGDLIDKMNSRKDKYNVSGKVHVKAGESIIHEMMEDYDGVIIWDLPPRRETDI